jgi:ribosomal protein L7/L12
MSTTLAVAIGLALVVALLAFVTRRARAPAGERRLDFRALAGAPLDRIGAELRAGRKIQAIALLRESTGAGLAQAKEAVEAFEKNLPLFEKLGLGALESAAPPEPGGMPEVRAALAEGRTIDAIRLYRERAGVGLKEAKDAIDALRGRN